MNVRARVQCSAGRAALHQRHPGGGPSGPRRPDISLRVYYAQPGEELFDIARRFHVSPGQMLEANGLEPDTRTLRQPAACWCPAPERRGRKRGKSCTVSGDRPAHRRRYLYWCGGPVRSGKSTFIKQFMEELVLPALTDPAAKTRARDELPQSAAGRTIMTTEPKFIPETAVPLQLEGGGECRVRLIDCVGYMVEGAMGHEENEKPRMVKSPWFDEAVPFDLAAETGTEKVIRDHSTIGVVVTTDGSISDIPRAGYEKAEARVIGELEELGKPYVILLNSAHPDSPETRQLAAVLEEQYGRSVLPVSCVDLDRGGPGKDSGVGAVRVPGAGAGFCDAQMGDHAGTADTGSRAASTRRP